MLHLTNKKKNDSPGTLALRNCYAVALAEYRDAQAELSAKKAVHDALKGAIYDAENADDKAVEAAEKRQPLAKKPRT